MSRCVHGYLKRLCPLCKPKISSSNPEITPGNARWVALLMDTEGSIG
ncbi:MAG: hypothetical protein QMD13_03020 [Candidatus Bathyarchaeia archaeon]|nr:hypothetical protein [Candidatus Bathyarchaeia archaeon]MDI6904451.1 hypothetical protein [Candidatus Bathyarchaeia archaeon]